MQPTTRLKAIGHGQGKEKWTAQNYEEVLEKLSGRMHS